MKKLLLVMAALFSFVLPVGNKTNSEFVGAAEDFENGSAVALTGRKNAKTTDSSKGADSSVGNTSSSLCSRMAVQAGNASCLRYVVAIPSLNVSVTFNATLTKENGNVSYYVTDAQYAYTGILASDQTITPDNAEFSDNGTTFSYFVCYTMKGITEANAKLEVSATVSDGKTTASVYNSGTVGALGANSGNTYDATEYTATDNVVTVTLSNGTYNINTETKTAALSGCTGEVTILDYIYANNNGSYTIYPVTSITSLGVDATKVTIPSTVTQIGSGAIGRATGLTAIIFETLPTLIMPSSGESFTLTENMVSGDTLNNKFKYVMPTSTSWTITY